MAGYFIANYKVTNPEGYAAYVPAAGPTMANREAEILVADYKSETIEGAPDNVTVVIKFPSKEAALDWYNSPEYQKIIHLRTDNTEGMSILTDEFVMPGR